MKELLEDKTFCIVGNAPTEFGKGNGEKIDSHDIVFRFNNFETEGFEHDYGTKTTFWVNTFCNDIKPKFQTFPIVCPLPLYHEGFLKRYSATNKIWFKESEKGIKMPPLDMFDELVGQIPNPSSGMALIWWIWKSGIPVKQENIFGFSFFENPTNMHYFNSNVVKTGHDGSSEKQLIQEIAKKSEKQP